MKSGSKFVPPVIISCQHFLILSMDFISCCHRLLSSIQYYSGAHQNLVVQWHLWHVRFYFGNRAGLTSPPLTDSSADKDSVLHVGLIYLVAQRSSTPQGLSSRIFILLQSFLLPMKSMEMNIRVKMGQSLGKRKYFSWRCLYSLWGICIELSCPERLQCWDSVFKRGSFVL